MTGGRSCCLRAWGGLPGLAYVERSAELDDVLAELTEGLEPF
jgi:hypothetical protein